jgi:site-specific DNA recombinase
VAERVTIPVPGLRIVSDELWSAEKQRQTAQSARVGERVKRGLTLARAGRTGKRPKYLFSGLLKCAVCGSNFIVSGPKQTYTCASRTNGGDHACENSGRVSRNRVEQALLGRIKEEPLGTEYQRIFAEEVRRLLSDGARTADAERQELESQMASLSSGIERYLDAIASGIDSSSLKDRLKAAEERLAHLKQDQCSRRSNADKAVRFLPNLAERYERIVGEAERALLVDVDRARDSLRGFLGEVKMFPGEKLGELIAEARIDGDALIRKCLSGNQNIRVVAGARVGPTSPRAAVESRRAPPVPRSPYAGCAAPKTGREIAQPMPRSARPPPVPLPARSAA